MRRLLLVPALAAFLSACFASHGPGGSPDAALPRADASIARDSSAPGPDAGPARDASRPRPDAAASCALPFSVPSVSIEAVGTGAAARGCTSEGSFEGAALYAAAAIDDGVELSLDLCPDADDDCRCLVSVRGIGEGAVPDLRDGGPVSGTLNGYLHGVVIERAPACPECEGAVRRLVFLAAVGPPEAPPVEADALTVRWGDPACSEPPDPSGCTFARRQLVFTGFVDGFPGPIGFETALDEGMTAELDESGVHARALFSHARFCGDTTAARAAWVAWR